MLGVRVPPHTEPIEFAAAFAESGPAPAVAVRAIPTGVPAARWPQEVTTTRTLSTAKDAYVVDDIALPLDNPWRRNVRPGDIQFLQDGTGVTVTLDGDVWLVRGLSESSGRVRWRRFASGLHEPLTLAIRDEQVYVFDRNGIWRLRDTNGDGEADVHELFSNAFGQTADMREFPSTLRLAPGGEFVIAKGNQQATTIGKHNGNVLRISADGRRADVLGYGFRQPNIAVNVRTGLVTASDQQGNYIPSTPLHIVRDRQFYGFLSDKLPREVYPAPIADPITWIPHAANASAMSQVWLFGARMGPLNDALVHIGFNNPEVFRVLLNERSPTLQAAVVSVTRAFDFPPLNGSVNPADGQLYLAGFQILGWGTTATRLAGLGRVRYTGAVSTVPREIVPMDTGVLLRFDAALDRAHAVNPDNYSFTSWHYKRTYQYGSPQFKADGTPGIDRLGPSHAYRLAGRTKRLRQRARHEARDADARGLVARNGGRRKVSGQRVLYALHAARVRSQGGRLWRSHGRPDAESRGRDSVRTGKRRGRPPAVSTLRLHGVPFHRDTADLQARSDIQGPLRQRAHLRQGSRPGDRRRGLSPGIDSGTVGEDRRRLRTR